MRTGALALCVCLVAEVASAAPPELDCAPTKDGDPKTRDARAAEHYQRGQELYAQGEFERSIAEFRATYCLVPVPEALHAIGQAYERLVDYEQAVAWFDRYLAVESPKEKDKIERLGHRVRILRGLPARVRVATEPPGADVVLVPERGGPEIRGTANADEALRLLAGRYEMRIERKDYQPIREQVRVEIGQPYSFSYRLVAKTGTVRVAVNPRDGVIQVDGKLAGIGGWVDELSIGEHEIVVEAPNRPRETRRVAVVADQLQVVNVVMKPPLPRNGRLELVIGGSLYGVTEGVGVGAVLWEDPVVALAGAALMGGGSLVVTMLLLPKRIPVGTTSLTLGARVWGAALGVALAAAIYGGHPRDAPYMTTGLSVGLSLVAAAGTYWLGQRVAISSGDAAVVNSAVLWGGISSALLWNAFTQEEKVFGPMFLAGISLGLLAGGTLSGQVELSRARMALIDLSGFGGLVAGTALATVVGDGDDPSRYALFGSVLGLVGGVFVTRYLGADDDGVNLTPVVSATPEGRAVFGLAGSF
jgi:hypothetical protein